MVIRFLSILCCLLSYVHGCAQDPAFACGQKEFAEKAFLKDPSLRSVQQEIERKLLSRRAVITNSNPSRAQGVLNAPVILPVVVHIIHNNGPENISDLQVQAAIQHLNEAFANIGYYDPSDGVNTNIQFCLAQRDPDNHPTNGITRDVSPYTVMNPDDPLSDDQNIKNIRRWNPLCYINIWIVKSIGPSYNGYANFPPAHGSDVDGIVVKAPMFGDSYPHDVVITHEMGHYLGLYHTFEGGCTNNNCSIDGDRVCDTPPDQSIASISCNQSMNSCSTDTLSGFSTDQNDLIQDYMDYGNHNCMKLFTQGQSDRMNWFVQNVLTSLLNCKSCMEPCPDPVTVSFTAPGSPLYAGTGYNFVNQSAGGISSFEWYVNGVLVSTSRDYSFTFDTVGGYSVRLVARANNSLCLDGEKTVYLYASCPGGCIPPPSPRDSCAVNTFQKAIGGSKRDLGLSADIDPDGNCLITGHTASVGAGGEDAQVIRIDAGGNILWAKAYGDALSNFAYDGKLTKDGGSIHIGIGNNRGGIGRAFFDLYKLDYLGNLEWSRSYGNPGFSLNGTNIIQTADGGFLISGSAFINPPLNINPAVLIKIDAYGNMIWCRQYFTHYSVRAAGMLEEGGRYVIVSTASLGFGKPNVILAFTVDKATGDPGWGNYYSVPGASGLQSFRIVADKDRYLLSLLYNSPGTNGAIIVHEGFLSIDGLGAVQGAYTIDRALSPDVFQSNPVGYTDVAIMDDGNICFYYGQDCLADSMDARLAELTPDGKLITAKRYVLPGFQVAQRIRKTPDGGILGVGYTVDENLIVSIYLLKTDRKLRISDPSQEAAGCTVTDENPDISQPAITRTVLTADAAPVPITVFDNNFVTTAVNPTITDICSNPSLCDTLKISGRDSVCVSGDTLEFKNGKNGDCSLPVQWQADASQVKIISTTDSSVRLVVRTAGAVRLYATLTVNCRIIRDSMLFHALSSPDRIDLGEDLALCRQSTVLLHAGSDFRSYRWQDGSADSIFTAWLPGKYYVSALDYCGRPYGDTIMISQAPEIPFHLGPDTSICRNGILLLSAPDGFQHYSWSPLYAISDAYSRSAKVYPDMDMTYTCTAVVGKGCTVIDSIHVRVTEACLPGIYFPNAFTPDHDGRNDVFRPVLSVRLDKYYMAVYNRLGERIFESRDYSKGWDGTFNGMVLGTGSFVWYASYHIAGSVENAQTLRGTVILIH